MITDEHITTYIHSLDTEPSPVLSELRTYAAEHEVPIIRREMESFIRVILEMKRPVNILEIGTAIGYSALLMCETLEGITSRSSSKTPDISSDICHVADHLSSDRDVYDDRDIYDYHIKTIENYEPRLEQARANFAGSGYAEHLTLIEDDAVAVLNRLAADEGRYDMVFLDAAKGQYITMLPDILKVLTPGGVLLADNVLTDGEIAMSRYALPRRQRTIHERMREFVWAVMHSDELETSVIPIGDGVTLSVRR